MSCAALLLAGLCTQRPLVDPSLAGVWTESPLHNLRIVLDLNPNGTFEATTGAIAVSAPVPSMRYRGTWHATPSAVDLHIERIGWSFPEAFAARKNYRPEVIRDQSLPLRRGKLWWPLGDHVSLPLAKSPGAGIGRTPGRMQWLTVKSQ